MVKPVLLSHGAYMGAWAWADVIAELERRGVHAVAVDLTSRDTGGTLEQDEQLVRKELAALGEPAILVGHSYSGAVITGASVNNDDVAHLVYVTAAVPQEGEGVTTASRFPLADLIEGDDAISIDPDWAVTGLFSDANEEQQARAIPQLNKFTLNAFRQIPSGLGWKEHPSTFVICTLDQGFPVEVQQRFAESTTESVQIESGHSPMITQPVALAEIIAEIAKR